MTKEEKTRVDFLALVERARKKLRSRDPARIADHMLAEYYARSRVATKSDGIYSCLRDGVIKHVKEQIRKVIDESQRDFSEFCSGFEKLIEPLSSGAYYVPSRREHLPIGQLIMDVMLLDEARKFHRMKGEEVLRESDALDMLYAAVIRRQAKSGARGKSSRAPQPEVQVDR